MANRWGRTGSAVAVPLAQLLRQPRDVDGNPSLKQQQQSQSKGLDFDVLPPEEQ
jgi:hypothetical protein